MDLKEIQSPVAEHIAKFEPYFSRSLQSPNKLLTLATNHIFRRKGKQMRPLLVFLAAQAAGGVTEASYAAAALIELLHNASLVHDDVVDEAYTRRAQWSMMGLWGPRIAVLVGDFFLARGMSLAVEGHHFDILSVVSDAVRDLVEGELSQMDHARKLDTDEAAYYDIIRQKTATLIRACTRAGATSVGAKPSVVDALAAYGEALGMAFQIRDDIFDYQPAGLLGKPVLNDIKEQKLTLPLIAAMQQATEAERRHLLKTVRRNPQSADTVALALKMVTDHNGIALAQEKMELFARKAKDALDFLPPSAARNSLAMLVDFNTKRKG